MYMPVFLMGDFGWPVWVAFAIPNVFGAALVGFAHRNKSGVAEFIDRHEHAIRLFSLVTVLFHVVFLTWFLTLPLGLYLDRPSWMSPPVVIIALLIAWHLSRLAHRHLMAVALVVWLASLVLLALAGVTTGWLAMHAPPALVVDAMPDLAWLAPVLALGFLTCPHLDRTILRVAHDASDGSRRAIFTLGYGFFFLVMITGTLLYASGFLTIHVYSPFIFVHIVLQSIFTMGVHLRELRQMGFVLKRFEGDRSRDTVNGIAVAALLVLALSVFNVREHEVYNHRFVYDLVLSMYALVFPAYVWIVAISRTRSPGHPLAVYVATLVLASPLFWLGAIERDWFWLTPGVGLVLIAPVAASLLLHGRASGTPKSAA
jgi:hypothetical protein